ncbi:MAG: GDP-mannose 4,6-dehydratase [Candidatus Zixiibacteriota bacterium]
MKRRNKALITGIAGFAGSYLAELLLEQGIAVYGCLAPGEKKDNIRHLLKDIEPERFDILKPEKVSNFVTSVAPEYIFHLAAVSSVGQSFAKERLTYDVNFTGTLNILEASLKLGSRLKKVVFTSSADVYGKFMPANKILKETQAVNPNSPYGISKVAAEYLACYYVSHHNLPVVISRSFNHTGPRHSETFVVPSFCRQIAAIEKGLSKPVIMVGDLSAKRDLSDVRDIVYGYYLMAEKGVPGEIYQLCSGRTVAIKTVLDKLLKMAEVPIKVEVDKSRLRKSDIPVLRGDNTKARKMLGWTGRNRLEDTLESALQYWRQKLSAKPFQG